jgi:hypothetical protein
LTYEVSIKNQSEELVTLMIMKIIAEGEIGAE